MNGVDPKTVITLVAVALAGGGGAGTLAASGQVQSEMKDLDSRLDKVELNQKILDLQQRQTNQTSEWNSEKLDKLLRSQDIDVPPKPPLPKSEITENHE